MGEKKTQIVVLEVETDATHEQIREHFQDQLGAVLERGGGLGKPTGRVMEVRQVSVMTVDATKSGTVPKAVDLLRRLWGSAVSVPVGDGSEKAQALVNNLVRQPLAQEIDELLADEGDES